MGVARLSRSPTEWIYGHLSPTDRRATRRHGRSDPPPDPVCRGTAGGSHARGQARPDSDIDLLITAPDTWLAQRDRFSLLGELWGAVAQADLSVDLVLHSCSEANRRAKEPWPWSRRLSATVFCSMASPEATRLLRIARRDLKMARHLLDPEVEEAEQG